MALFIRLARVTDAAEIQAIYAPYVINTPASLEIDAPSVEEMERRIETTLQKYPYFVCVDGTQVVGYAYASQHRVRKAYDWSVEISVYISPMYQRRGIGLALSIALLECLRRLGYGLAISGVTQPNPASMALHTRLGFTLVGVYRAIGFKLGRWHDSAWLERDLRSGPVQPTPGPDGGAPARPPTELLPPPPGPPLALLQLGDAALSECLAAGATYLL
jgi:L-amino acid N-acyltransferase YncA